MMNDRCFEIYKTALMSHLARKPAPDGEDASMWAYGQVLYYIERENDFTEDCEKEWKIYRRNFMLDNHNNE